ncbi:MAG TPA: alpha/beta hydrolase [Ohtaekwangia sp.]
MRISILTFSIFIIFSCNTERFTQEDIRHDYLTVKDHQLYYEEVGEGEPLIFLHAGLMNSTMWSHQVEFFANQGYRVICIDDVGHGKTKDGKDTVRNDENILALLNHLRLEKASLVGLSWGGIHASDFAVEYPDKVNKLVLVSAAVNNYFTREHEDSLTLDLRTRMDSAFSQQRYDTATELFIQTWLIGPHRTAEAVSPETIGYMRKTVLEKIQEHGMETWTNLRERPALHDLDQITCPVLILTGTEDLEGIKKTAAIFRDSIPTSYHMEFSGVAHMINLERPDEFNHLLLTFLKDF